jgi:hypothetical protein
MVEIWKMLTHTPWWVYLLLAYIIRVGLQASNTQVLSFSRLFIAPVIFTAISLHTLLLTVKVSYMGLLIWGCFIIAGIMLGTWLIERLAIKVDKKHSLIQIPGTWSTLIVMAIIFLSKYYFAYELTRYPHYAERITFVLTMLAISALCTGLLLGKLLGYLYKIKHCTDSETLI